MSQTIKLKKPLEIWIPINITYMNFSLKESAKLSKLHMFLLKAINEYDADIESIADATKLTENVIGQELHDMYNQKLLDLCEDGKYKLTSLSSRLIKYESMVSMINNEKIPFMFNFVTGRIIPGIDSALQDEPQGVAAKKILSTLEIDCIEPKEIKDILYIAYPFFNDNEEELIDDFLENVIITNQHSKTDKWKKMYITELPENEIISETDSIFIQSYVTQMEYQFFDEYLEKNSPTIQKINDIYEFDSLLITERAYELMKKSKRYCEQKSKKLQWYYNPVNSKIIDVFNSNKTAGKTAFNLQDFKLPRIDANIVINCLNEKYSFEFMLVNTNIQDIPFVTSLPLDCIVENIEEGI